PGPGLWGFDPRRRGGAVRRSFKYGRHCASTATRLRATKGWGQGHVQMRMWLLHAGPELLAVLGALAKLGKERCRTLLRTALGPEINLFALHRLGPRTKGVVEEALQYWLLDCIL